MDLYFTAKRQSMVARAQIQGMEKSTAGEGVSVNPRHIDKPTSHSGTRSQ